MYILPVAPGRSRLFYWHKAGSPGGFPLDRLKSLRAPFAAGKAQLQRLVAAAEKFFVAYERCKRHMYLHPIFEAVGGLLHGQVHFWRTHMQQLPQNWLDFHIMSQAQRKSMNGLKVTAW